MKFLGFFTLAIKSLSANKLHSSLTMLGIIIGVGAVITLVSKVVSLIDIGGMTIHPVVSTDIVILAISVSVFIGLASGIYPAMRAVRLNPIDALRYG